MGILEIMKKHLYIFLFTLLGALAGFLIHALIEIPVIALLVSDFERWGLGLSWRGWETVHIVTLTLLLVLGAYIGFRQGIHWWKVIYGRR